MAEAPVSFRGKERVGRGVTVARKSPSPPDQVTLVTGWARMDQEREGVERGRSASNAARLRDVVARVMAIDEIDAASRREAVGVEP